MLHPAGEVQGRESSRVNCNTIKSMCWDPGLTGQSPALQVSGLRVSTAHLLKLLMAKQKQQNEQIPRPNVFVVSCQSASKVVWFSLGPIPRVPHLGPQPRVQRQVSLPRNAAGTSPRYSKSQIIYRTEALGPLSLMHSSASWVHSSRRGTGTDGWWWDHEARGAALFIRCF